MIEATPLYSGLGDVCYFTVYISPACANLLLDPVAFIDNFLTVYLW